MDLGKRQRTKKNTKSHYGGVNNNNSSSLKILTFNIFGGNGFGQNCKKLHTAFHPNEVMGKIKADLINAQEVHETDVLGKKYKENRKDKKKHMYEVVGSHGNKTEKIACFASKTFDINRLSNFKGFHTVLTAEQKKKLNTRSGLVYNVKFGGHTLSIANFHLEGGRFADQYVISNTNDALQYKLSLLNKILSVDPDIIMGDFNAIYSENYSNNDLEGAKNWLKSLHDYPLNKHLNSLNVFNNNTIKNYNKPIVNNNSILEIAKKWNKETYEPLKKNYVYITPSGHTETNPRGHTIIDTVWVKKSVLEKGNLKFETKIIDIGKDEGKMCLGGISDHNPVLLTITK